jgi:DNA-binding NarL/FixJ family response regulator
MSAPQAMQKIMIVESGSLLEDGVAHILRQEEDLNIAGLAYHDDAAFLSGLIEIQPDIILLNEDGPISSAHVFELLVNWSFLVSVRIIAIHVEDNRIDFYERKSIFATQIGDLIGLIRRNYISV